MISFEVIVRYMNGEALPEEALLVDEWINKQEDNRAFFKELHTSWLKDGSASYNFPDIKAEWEEFERSHISPEPITTKVKPHRFLKTAIAACIIIAIGAGFIWFQLNREISSSVILTVGSDTARIKIQLPDHSQATLEKYAILKYPQEFSKDSRQVTLNGDAEFSITRDAKKPFIVNMQHGVHVKVLGTSFSIRQKPDSIFLKVITGKVAFYNQSDTLIVKANEEAYYIGNSFLLVPESYHRQTKTGSFYFKDEPLSKAVEELNYYYKTNIRIKSEKLNQCRLTAKFDNKTVEEVIVIISETLNIQYRINEGTIYLSGQGCN